MSGSGSGSGRRRDVVWHSFESIKISGRRGERAKCKKCGTTLEGQVSRMRNHLTKCSSREDDDDIVEIVNADADCEQGTTSASTATATCSSSSLIGTEQGESVMAMASTSSAQPFQSEIRKKRRTEKSIESFVVKTSISQKEALDRQTARYIFATNSPFRHVDHPQFIRLIEKLRPGYKPPSRRDLSGGLLDQIYDEEKQKFRGFLRNEVVCLGFDGWSNVHNEPIVCLTVTPMSGEVYLLDTFDTSGHAHTADYLETITYDSIKKCEDELKCKVRSVVTDNAANVKKTRTLLEKRPDLDVITYGCSAHILNLLANDCQLSDITKHVLSVVKYFRNNHFANACYRKSGNLKLVVPIEVRWNTMCDCLESYVKAWPTMLKICEENREIIDKAIQSKVGNVGIKRNAEDLLLLLKPISVALDRVQKNNCTIGDCVRVWKELENSFKINGNEENLKKFKSRYEMAMTEAHFLSYMLDPKEKLPELDLTQEEKSQALDFAKERYPESDILPMIIKFQAKSTPFQKHFFNISVTSKVTTIEWWRSQKNEIDKIDNNIISIVEQLHTAQASSASVERIFSSFGLVQSKLRNSWGLKRPPS